ncbi:MAG TPA: zinc-binding dehydrogenase, partial [Planctomycetaceae bacterium]|nr:zinc-binding dehydrogenase [Planctomycetaceae bacterium]
PPPTHPILQPASKDLHVNVLRAGCNSPPAVTGKPEARAFAMPHGGVQMWFETQREPTFDRTVSLMAPRGRIILMAGRAARPEFPVGPFYVKDLRVIGFAMFNASPEEQRTSAEALNALYLRAQWKPQIGATFPLSETAAAHRLQEDNSLHKAGTLRGKIVVIPG